MRVKGALTRHRNVLNRTERVMRLQEEEKWTDGDPVLGLPKVAHRKSHAGRKPAKEAVEGAVVGTPEGAVPGAAAPTAGAKPVPGAKAAAGAPAAKPAATKATAAGGKPAAGGKGAAAGAKAAEGKRK